MKRQRIEGQLHRSLAASLTIRTADPAQADDGLLRLRLSVSSELPYLRSSWWDEPWIEVLGHQEGEIDLARFNGGATVLANHDRYTPTGATPLAGIGAIERAWIENGRLECDLVISRREALADLRQDIADGLVRNVSIGYQINERVLTKAGPEGQPSEYRVTSWTPFEVSLVDIPADPSVGLGRNADGSTDPQARPRYRVIDLSPTEGAQPHGERSMPQANPSAENNPTDDTTTITATRGLPAQPRQQPQPDAFSVERERMREIRTMGRECGMPTEVVDKALDDGTSVEAFRAKVIQQMKDTGKIRAAESPEIGMGESDLSRYSFVKLLHALQNPLDNDAQRAAGLEIEASVAARKKRDNDGDNVRKHRESAMTIPVDVLRRGMGLSQTAAASAARELVQRAKRGAYQASEAFRDLVVGTNTAGGNLVATELLSSSFIDLLRNAMVLDRLGVTWLRDLNGNVAIPSATGTATTYWVAESGSPTESQQTFGQVTLTPKTVGAFTDYSRRLMIQSSIDIEAFVRADLAAMLGQAIQLAAINGSGTSNQPTGLLNTSGIGAVIGGTNGAVPTYDFMVDLETAVADANADNGSLAYLTNTAMRGKLRKTQEFGGTNGKPVWGRGPERGVGDVLGYDAVVSNAVPRNLTKGTSSNCSAIMFGNWADLLIGMWGGLDLMLDPFTGATSGTKRVIALQDVDVALRRVTSFAAMKDALPA